MAAILTAALGFILVATTLTDIFQVLLLPRRVRTRLRLSIWFFRAAWSAWRAVGRLLDGSRRRAAFLAIFGPLSVVALCAIWASMLVVGYALFQWALGSGLPKPPRFLDTLYLSGSTLFTLGFGDIVPHTALGKALCVVEAGTGFGLIAGVIGYLPVLYQLFSRRESHIMQLDARAGSPPSALALLGHLSQGQTMENLDDFLRAWEVWSAELLESHLSYPMLVFYRSQHDNQSWLAALTTIMDCCALMLCGLEGVRPFQAKMTFAMGRLAVIEMANVFRLAPVKGRKRSVSGNDEDIVAMAAEAGLLLSGDPGPRLAELRSTYEPFLIPLAEALLIDLPDFLPSEAPDNWHMSLHGSKARDLVGGSSPVAEPIERRR